MVGIVYLLVTDLSTHRSSRGKKAGRTLMYVVFGPFLLSHSFADLHQQYLESSSEMSESEDDYADEELGFDGAGCT